MKIVVGQGSCGIATGAKKVANRFEEILGEKNIDINVDITGCIGTCFLEPIVDIYEDAKDEPTRYVKVKPEDVVEINCHGGVVSTNKVLESTIKAGARIAEPGEFTKRAFLNGRIDLSQAEAVMDLIRAKTDLSMKSALMQSSGYLSRHINKLR